MHSGTTWETEGISGSHVISASGGRGTEGERRGMTADHVLHRRLHHHRMVEQQQQQHTHTLRVSPCPRSS